MHSKWRNKTLVGKTFGHLKVVSLYSKSTDKGGGRVWKCICQCGKEYLGTTGALSSGNTRSCGCLKTPNLIGQRFYKLVVLKDEGIRKANVVWLCRCDCGGSKTASTYSLKNGVVRSCGCLRSGWLQDGKVLKPGIATRNRIIATYKSNAKLCNRVFTLSSEECEVLFKSDCYYCGDPPLRTRTHRTSKDSYTYNGIDRLNNLEGYTTENSVSCCTTCNLRKGSASKEEFLKWVEKIAIKHFK